jgi:hypothetical protein
MELKAVGKLGMVKRKQFLQKRDISRSHEVKSYVYLLENNIDIYILFKQIYNLRKRNAFC